jgi:pimeloyl-ACP methyl ester carboxylesterase
MPNQVSRRGLLQAATALGISGGLDPLRALAQEAPGRGPAEYYNKQGPVVSIAPGLELGYRDDWLGAPWEKPEVMLLIHGNIESSIVWYGWVPRLGSEYRLLRPDLPGFGRSTLPANFEWKLPNVAAVLAKFLDKMGVESAHVIAAKTGGAIGVQFAASYPQRTKTLVLATAPLSPDPKQADKPGAPYMPEFKTNAEKSRWLEERQRQSGANELDESKRLGSAASKQQIDFYNKMMLATRPEPSYSLMKMLTDGRNSKHLESLLPRITAPTLVITSDRNAMVSVPQAFGNQQKIPNARLLVITSDAYHIILANTDEVVTNIRAFIATHKRA